jgi:hypothetical protein
VAVAVTLKLPAVEPLIVKVELPEPLAIVRVVALKVAVTDGSEVVAVKLIGAAN